MLGEKKRAAGAKTYNDAQVQIYVDCVHQSWQLYTSQLNLTTEKLGWDKVKRQEAWEKGHGILTSCIYDYMDRQGELKAERLRKRAD